MKHHSILFVLLALVGCARQPLATLPVGLRGPAPIIDERFAIALDEQRIMLTLAYFKKHNHAYWERIKDLQGEEALRITPRLVVVHYTALSTLQETIDYFRPDHIAGDRGSVTAAGALNVGIQFVVDRDGTIYRQYPETAAARHVIGLNHVAIGIENVGNADLGATGPGVLPLTEAQLVANARLIRYLAGKYPTLRYVIGHSEYQELEQPEHPAHALFHEDVAGYRTQKSDPGQNFMAKLRRALTKTEP